MGQTIEDRLGESRRTRRGKRLQLHIAGGRLGTAGEAGLRAHQLEGGGVALATRQRAIGINQEIAARIGQGLDHRGQQVTLGDKADRAGIDVWTELGSELARSVGAVQNHHRGRRQGSKGLVVVIDETAVLIAGAGEEGQGQARHASSHRHHALFIPAGGFGIVLA